MLQEAPIDIRCVSGIEGSIPTSEYVNIKDLIHENKPFHRDIGDYYYNQIFVIMIYYKERLFFDLKDLNKRRGVF